MIKLLMICFIMIINLNLLSDENNMLSGYFSGFNYLDVTKPLSNSGFTNKEYDNDLNFDRSGIKLQLRLNDDITNEISFDVTVNFENNLLKSQRNPDSEPEDGFATYFKEGFISIRDIFHVINFKIGRQYIFFGRFEWGGALDIVSPWDFNNMSAEKENFRTAVDSIYLFLNLNQISFEALAVPIFVPNHIAFDLPAQMGPFKSQITDAELPKTTLNNVEFGFRFIYPLFFEGESTITYYKGFDRTFSLYVTPDLTNYILTFTPKYKPVQTIGIDFEFDFFNSKFIFESAYIHTDDESGENIFVKNRRLKNSIGFEKDFGSFSFMGVFARTDVLNYDRNQEYKERKELGEQTPYAERTVQYEAIYRLKYTQNESFSVSLMNILNLNDFNMMGLLFSNYQIATNLKWYCGIVFFKGEDGTRFGKLETQSRFFNELKYTF